MQGSTPVDCEVLNVIQGAGIWPDCNDKTQLLQAINTLISGGGSGGGNTVIIGSEIGTVSAFAMPTAPDGWLVCDGSPVSRTEYADLLATIGTVWGHGDEITTFLICAVSSSVVLMTGGMLILGVCLVRFKRMISNNTLIPTMGKQGPLTLMDLHTLIVWQSRGLEHSLRAILGCLVAMKPVHATSL